MIEKAKTSEAQQLPGPRGTNPSVSAGPGSAPSVRRDMKPAKPAKEAKPKAQAWERRSGRAGEAGEAVGKGEKYFLNCFG